MKTACPNCGGEVEFRYDDSFVRVCPFCRSSVLRTDRGAETLGQFADLVPYNSPLKLFASGVLGHETFLLVGMAQVRQASGGISQEWYAKFDGRWGWLAEAQGRYYLTFEVPDAPELPRFETVIPGERMQLPHQALPYTVGERGQAQYISATGELPFRLPAGQNYRFIDLSDGQGAFATLDYNDGSEAPSLFEGRQVTLAELQLTGGEDAPNATTPKAITSAKITCPQCGAPIELRAGGQALRVACSYCDALVSLESTSAKDFVKLKTRAKPSIPLGTLGTFSEGELLVVGFVARSANVEGAWYGFEEYLLYREGLGFRWLVNSDGHWNYTQPIAPGAVEYQGSGAKYDGVKFRLYQGATTLRVDTVLGEFYWRVTAGELVTGEDFIAPPAMLSREANKDEENWTLSTYMTPKQVQEAFGNRNFPLGDPLGVAPNQVYPIHGFSTVSSVAFVAMIIVAIVSAVLAKNAVRFDKGIEIQQTNPAATTPAATAAALAAAAADVCAEMRREWAIVDSPLTCANVDEVDKSMLRSSVAMAVPETEKFASYTCPMVKANVERILSRCEAKVVPPPERDTCADYTAYAKDLSICSKINAQQKATIEKTIKKNAPKKLGSPTKGENKACAGALDAARVAATKAGCTVADPGMAAAKETTATTATNAGSGSATAGSGSGSAAPTEPQGSVYFSDPFELAGGENIEVEVKASSLNNDWVYFAADLVEDKTGQVTTFDDNLEYYSGVDDGESWDEGSRSTSQLLPPVPGGKYVLRLESSHGGAGTQHINVSVRQGIFRWLYFFLALLVLGVPFFFFGLHEWSFEKKRWENSSVGVSGAPRGFSGIFVAMFVGFFGVLWSVISSLGDSND